MDVEITANLCYPAGDRILLYTDEIWSMITESKLIEMISKEDDVESVVTNLVDRITPIGIGHGGNHDNLTAALLEMETISK